MGRFLGYLGKRVLSYAAMVFIATSLTFFFDLKSGLHFVTQSAFSGSATGIG